MATLIAFCYEDSAAIGAIFMLKEFARINVRRECLAAGPLLQLRSSLEHICHSNVCFQLIEEAKKDTLTGS